MGNYIKTLILSTIVLVMGNNSNYCYSNQVFNNMVSDIQQAIAQNNHVIMNYDLSERCNYALFELYHTQPHNAWILSELIRAYTSIVAFLDDVIVNDDFDFFDEQAKEFAKQLVNRLSMPVVNMLTNIRNQMQNNQLLNQQQLKELIINSVLHCAEEIINVANSVLLDLGSPNNQLDNNATQHVINNIKGGITKLRKLRRWILLIINDHNAMINGNFSGECTDELLKLFHYLDNNSPHSAHVIYDFARIYNSIVAMISGDEFIGNFVEDYRNEFIGVTENDLDNAREFANQLSNSITKHAINMLINIGNERLNNNLSQQQLETLIANSVSHCIDDIIDTSNDVIIELTTNNNPLSNIYNRYPNNNCVELAVNNIITGIEKLHELKHQYNLH